MQSQELQGIKSSKGIRVKAGQFIESQRQMFQDDQSIEGSNLQVSEEPTIQGEMGAMGQVAEYICRDMLDRMTIYENFFSVSWDVAQHILSVTSGSIADPILVAGFTMCWPFACTCDNKLLH